MTKAVPDSAETPETTDQSIVSGGLTVNDLDYPGSKWNFVDSVVSSVTDLYRSVVNPAASPELSNDKAFDQIRLLVRESGINITSLQDGLNAILKERGIPESTLHTYTEPGDNHNSCRANCEVPKGDSLGTYEPGTGKIGINERIFKSGNIVLLGKTAIHETNHYLQDILITRAIMDDVAKSNPANFLDSVSQIYKNRFGIVPTDNFLQNVEKMRAGVELTSQERLRADRLTEGRMAMAQDALRPNAIADLKVMTSFLERLKGSNGRENEHQETLLFAKELFKLMSSSSGDPKRSQDWRRMLFGGENIGKRDLIRMFGAEPGSSNFDFDRARTVLTQLFEAGVKSLTASKESQVLNYRRYTHEDESYDLAEAYHSYIKRR